MYLFSKIYEANEIDLSNIVWSLQKLEFSDKYTWDIIQQRFNKIIYGMSIKNINIIFKVFTECKEYISNETVSNIYMEIQSRM